jgi:hypothetical protein
MRFYLSSPETVEISRLNLLVAECLRQTPFEAEPGKHEGARDRLYSTPMTDLHADPTFLEDWHDLVRPELETIFRGATEIVARDLVGLREEKLEEGEGESPSFVIRIPISHLEAWLSCLNQARLVISEKFSFGEEAMNSPLSSPPAGKRELALYQVHFYAVLQELILDIMRMQEGEPSYFDSFRDEDEDSADSEEE